MNAVDPQPRRNTAAGPVALAASIATLAFLLPWWNRHLGLTLDGYLPYFGHRIFHGEIPYRDFFFHLPPLQAIADGALEAIFGRSLLAIRLAGVAGRIALGALTAVWLARRFRPGTALVLAMIALFVASSDGTDILDFYNHHVSLAAVASGLLAAIALDGGRRERLAWGASGFAAALGFWIKQTVGLGATVATPLVLVLLAVGDPRQREKLPSRLGAFAAGWSVPSLLLGGWLAAHGALRLFLHDNFLDAAASKGSPAALLLRPWLDPLVIHRLLPVALIGGLAAILGLAVVRLAPGTQRNRSPWLEIGVGLGVVLGMVVVGNRFAFPTSSLALGHDLALWIRLAPRVAVFVAVYGLLWPAVVLGLAALRRPLDRAESQLLLLVVASSAIAATHALSYPSGGPESLPGAAVVAGIALEGAPRFRYARLLVVPLLAVMLVSGVSAVALRQREPFGFALWVEPPVRNARTRSALPELRGLRLSAPTRNTVDSIVRLIGETTRPGEPIYTYSACTLFYWLGDRPAATFAALQWFDVTPDSVVDADLPKLLADPPVLVIRQSITRKTMQLHEEYFRNGHESAVRRTGAALDKLLLERYVRIYESERPTAATVPFEVWLRSDRAAELGRRAVVSESNGSPRRSSARAAANRP